MTILAIKLMKRTLSLIIFFLIISIPFAKIIAIGNKIKISSDPFFLGRKSKITQMIVKFELNKIQFFLNLLLIDKAWIDLMKSAKNVKKKRLLISQK
jgi:hypothetical protein